MGRVHGEWIAVTPATYSSSVTPPRHSNHGCPRLYQGQGRRDARRVRHEQGGPRRSRQADVRQQLCRVGEKFDMEYAVKKMDMEIHNLEMETSESHGTFKIPKLKKVNKFKMMGDEEEAK